MDDCIRCRSSDNRDIWIGGITLYLEVSVVAFHGPFYTSLARETEGMDNHHADVSCYRHFSHGLQFTTACPLLPCHARPDRTDILREQERGFGAAVFVTGYRIAALVSGALALILSDRIGWQNTYLLMAGIMGIGIVSTLLGPAPKGNSTHPGSMKEAIWGPMKDYFSRNAALLLLLLIILYKLGDAYAGTLTTAFLLKGPGFSASEVGTINKGLGFASVIIGALIGGTLMIRLGLFRALLIFGILQAVSNLSFMLLALTGKNYGVLIFTVAFENLTGGMGTSAFVSLLMAMCNHRYTATQYALLSSLAALGRIFISPTSGFLVESVGWAYFFFTTFLVALPGLLLLWWLRDVITGLKTQVD